MLIALGAVAADAKPHKAAKPAVSATVKHHAATKTPAPVHHHAANTPPLKPRITTVATSAPAPQPETPLDLTHAVPLDQYGKLPSTQDRYKNLQNEIQKTKPAVDSAKQKSTQLKSEAEMLRTKLVQTATRVQTLESEKGQLDSAIAELTIEERQMEVNFSRDRIRVARLLAVLERLQHDMPPVIVLKSDDALGATHGAMLLGASLPKIYQAAASLSRRLEALRNTRAQLQARRVESAHNAVKLSSARVELDQLLAIKEREAQAAISTYGDLQSRLDTIANEATGLRSLLDKVAAMRRALPANQSVVIVGPQEASATFAMKHGSLRRPVVGRMLAAGDGTAANMSPGVTFITGPVATVVAPADSQVLFAGPYHKSGQALILEMPGGYDLVLAGLERIAVRTGDQLLAGEPVGSMPLASDSGRLYFEIRQNGKSLSPAPWLEPDLKADLRKAKRS